MKEHYEKKITELEARTTPAEGRKRGGSLAAAQGGQGGAGIGATKLPPGATKLPPPRTYNSGS